MGEQLLSRLKNCSAGTKERLNIFFKSLVQPQGTESNSVQKQLEAIFNKITRDFSLSKVRELSKVERNQKDLTNYQFSYGQITFGTIFKIISKVKKHKNMGHKQIFYDLGSGSGKVLLAASLCYPFAECKGIEYLQALYTASEKLKNSFKCQSKQIEEKISQILNEQFNLPQIQIFNQNFQKMNWSDGTIIFVSSTCYTRQIMYHIQQLCQKLMSGTILITLTRSIQNINNSWKLLEKFQGSTSWGSCNIFVHIKHQ